MSTPYDDRRDPHGRDGYQQGYDDRVGRDETRAFNQGYDDRGYQQGYDDRGRQPAYDDRAQPYDDRYDDRGRYDDRDRDRDRVPERRAASYDDRERVVAAPGERFATEPKSNPVAGILLIIGGLMALLAGLIPSGGSGQIPIAGAIDGFSSGETNAIIASVALLVVFVCGFGALAAGAQMFAAKWHAGPARTGMTMAVLMIIAALAVIIIVGTGFFHVAGFPQWCFILAGIPTLIGALIGMARK